MAWKAFQQVLKVNPANYQALGYIAIIQRDSGQIDAAAETYLRIGYIFAGQNDLETAIEAWQQANSIVRLIASIAELSRNERWIHHTGLMNSAFI